MQSKRADKGSGYTSLADHLIQFNDLGQLPSTLLIGRLDEGHGIEAAMVENKAQYHQTCRLKYNETMLKRAKKRACSEDPDQQSECKLRRSQPIRAPEMRQDICFFCRQPAGNEGLREAATFKLDNRVRTAATLLQDTELLGRLSAGDMVAIEAKYHARCLLGLYHRVRKANLEGLEDNGQGHAASTSGVVFAELVLYIEESRQHHESAPVFKLAELSQLYKSRMEQLGVEVDSRVHSTRLKERLLAEIPDMRAYTKGRDVLMAFKDDIGTALAKACEQDNNEDAMHLARAAQIVRRHIFGETKQFNGFPEKCQEDSVPQLLLTLVNMILEGPSIKDQMQEATSPAALTIAQLLKFNSVKHKRAPDTAAFVRHSTAQETPVPLYVGLMLHAHTRKKELVDKMAHLGLSVSYDRVFQISTQMGNHVCQQFHREQVVCPPQLRSHVFTTAAVDNIDHNPSSTTARDSFHGTAISLIQHPSFVGEGTDRSLLSVPEGGYSRTIDHLPAYYTEVPPVASNIKDSKVPETKIQSLTRDGISQHTKEEYQWLDNASKVIENKRTDSLDTSWAAFHASRQTLEIRPTCSTVLLPLFQESAHTVAMIKHSLDVISKSVEHLNPGQGPVVTFDQPLYALAKQIQFKWPEKYGEDKLVVMFGGLHIEMAALKMLGHWLSGSGWVEALVQADITSPGTADSFLKAAHVSRTRRAHQITAAALNVLQHRAYDNYCQTQTDQVPLAFEAWCTQRAENIPQFEYWSIVLELELLVLVFVRSLREGSFSMYLDALTELAKWFHAMDHTHYARWIPVHLRDMAELPRTHPDIAEVFMAGKFTVQKTKHVFSSMAIDQAHEQMNACIKGDGGAVGLTDNPSALLRWMVAGPEVARSIQEFEVSSKKSDNTHHHDQTTSVQVSFIKDVRSLVNAMEHFGNPFEEESKDLIVLHSKELAGPSAAEAVRKVKQTGKHQFEAFTRERLVERTKTVDDTIPRNKLLVFGTSTQRRVSKPKQKLISLKQDMELFSRLFIACQTRDGNLDEFFRHENQPCPPALSDGGSLRLGVKSDLLPCLEQVHSAYSDSPKVTCTIVDGAAITQILKPSSVKTFNDYAHVIFIPYLTRKFESVSRLDLVWDRYLSDSLKAATRAKRGAGIQRRVVGDAAIPRNWQNFLRVDSNKTELFAFLSNALLRSFVQEDKQLVVTSDMEVFSKPPLPDRSSIAPCTHEEADSRMLLHVAHAAKNGHHKMMIQTVDTDVVVLAVAVAQTLQPEDELWLAFGTGKNFRYLAAHEIAAGLGPEKARTLPMFHALTGCDTVSSFVGHGKKTAWAVWSVFPELTHALLKVSSAPNDIPQEVMATIERFIILLYDRTSTCTEIDTARRKLFAKRHNAQSIPPTKAALEEHVKRALYQGGHVWGQVLVSTPELPSPCKWGWSKTSEGDYEPFWTCLPDAGKSSYELVSCKCKKGCVGQCKCKKAHLQCTALCFCEGECD